MNMEVGTKVRLKSGEGPLMTVKRVTAAGYRVCYWYAKDVYQERMFLPEMVVREDTSAPTPSKGTDPVK